MVLWRLQLQACTAQVLAVCIVPVQRPLRVLFHAHVRNVFGLKAHVGGFLLRMQRFYSLGWVVMACRLLLPVRRVLAMWTGLTGVVSLATVVPLAVKSI